MRYIKPGATISDGSLPEASKSPTGRIEYTVPADPADLDKTIRHAVDATPFVPSDVPRRPWRLLVLSAVNVGILVAMATLFWLCRRKARLRRQQRG